MKRGTLFNFLLAASLPMLAFAYSSPGQPHGFVNDFAGVLTVEQRTSLETELAVFQNDTLNEIAVVTVKNLGGDTVENFAEELFREWGIGKKGQDNGVLMLVAVDDRRMRIEVGYGLEGALTDAQSNWIINNVMKPAFRANDFSGGIGAAVSKIIDATKGEVVPSESSNRQGSGNGFDPSNIFFLVIFIPVWLASILGRSKSWWAGGVVGGVIGAGIGLFFGFFYFGIAAIAVLIPLGLIFDFFVSRSYASHITQGLPLPWWIGGGRRGGGWGGGGFGGFGGGLSGGGGSSGSW